MSVSNGKMIVLFLYLYAYACDIGEEREPTVKKQKYFPIQPVKCRVSQYIAERIIIDQPRRLNNATKGVSLFDQETSNKDDREASGNSRTTKESDANTAEVRESIFRKVNEMRKQGVEQEKEKNIEQKVVSKLKEFKDSQNKNEESAIRVAANQTHQSIFAQKCSPILILLHHFTLVLLI